MKIIKILCLMVVLSRLGDWAIEALEAGLLTGMTDGMELALNLQALKNKHKHRYNRSLVPPALPPTKKPLPIIKNVRWNQNKNGAAPIVPIQSKDDLPDMPVYYQGWLKYLKIRENPQGGGTNKPRQFFKNDLFDIQNKNLGGKVMNITANGDVYGSNLIPSELHFFSVIYKNSFTILSSREDTLQRTIDVMNIDDIKPIPESNNFLGGVRDFGKFSEGFCFRVLTKEPMEPFVMSQELLEPKTGMSRKWVFCFDDDKIKEYVMRLLIKLKVKKQHRLGIYVEIDKKGKLKESGKDGINQLKKDNLIIGKGENVNDGYWILLQDWGQCTLKCGGGEQFQQLMCIPPKGEGKPCEGPSVRKRPCNVVPCPVMSVRDEKKGTVNDLKAIIGSNDKMNPDGTEKINKDIQLPPIMKVMAISNRPSRYDKCVIKEGDAFMLKDDETTKTFVEIPRVPVKIILNEKTFSVFQDDDMKNQIKTMNIKDTTFFRVISDPRCFILKTKSGDKTQLCQLGPKDHNDWVEEWDYDFNLFKHQCYKPRSKSEIAIQVEEDKQVNKEFDTKINQIKVEIIQKKKKEIIKKIEEEDEIQFLAKVEDFKKSSFKAIQKENKLEELLEKEEEKKEEEEVSEMKIQIEHEEKKNQCLMKAIKEKELEDQYNISKAHFEEQIKDIQQDTQNEIHMKRLEIKKKILEMRKKQDRKKRELEGKIISIRSVMAERLEKAARVGNADRCFIPGTSTQIIYIKYCRLHFSSEPEKFTECIDASNYCYVCCENEFGDLHIMERDQCYNKCDRSPKFRRG